MKKIYNLHGYCKLRSAYEVAEDLQICAEVLGKKDEEWKQLAELLRYINSHASTVGGFPLYIGKGELG